MSAEGFGGHRDTDRRRVRVSPARLFLLLAIGIAVAFGVSSLVGLEEYTAVLSGTVANEGDKHRELFLGLLHVKLWFGATVLAPILVLAAAICAIGGLATRRRESTQ